ncbi:SusC/RagA family TonB-linked outer membrane protein [Sphingobacterium lactis]|uniref:TonB-linked outer membrane protein, SusC/RagA family n=1 Tax=Sphingobacterium lactis TaxID=797291 RepID=A0A1H6B4P9_9SPHI|nr:SusC/RagA family TonB-linked outer membrane protein [Sphingobacterium lactis]SEG55829.1 TonB-linked outer membrane protein, SusC/RagA family [Sphingobacterium lactis]
MYRSSKKLSKVGILLIMGMAMQGTATGSVPYYPVETHVVQEQINVRITVKDQETGTALSGVNMLVDGKAIGFTNDSGVFQGTVTKGTTIRLRMIGYTQTSITVERETYAVGLNSLDESIDEVVVTALGIKREEKALGYATTTVKGEQLTDAMSSNWMDALSGKVAGLNLMRSNAGPVGSTKIILRGESNLTDNNEALIVVDGVVVNGGSGRRSSLGSDSPYGTSSDNMPVDYGSGMDDINPDDIESVTVLKGPGAAALYGSRAANGAVIITTKTGTKKERGIGVTINSNTSFESMNRSPELQYEYGQGTGGAAHYSMGSSIDGGSTSGTSSAYGPKFDGQNFFQLDPTTQKVGLERTPWRAYDGKQGVNGFFDVGRTFTNSVSIDGNTDKTSARFSATNVQNKWIVPNTGYKRNTFSLAVNSKVSEKLTINTKVSYNNRWSDNLPGTGYGNQSLMYWYIFWQPSANIEWLRDYWVKGEEQRKIFYPYSTYPENPYAISYEFINANNRHTFTGNAQASYQFTKELSLQVRAAMDFSAENRNQNRPYDAGSKLAEGSFRTQSIFSRETNADFLLRYAKKLNDDFDFSATVGGATLNNEYRRDDMTSDGLTYPGIYNHGNAKYGIKTQQLNERFQTNSFYGLFTAAYKEFLFLDFTGRMDWTSTLAAVKDPDKKLNFFYPSVNASFVISEVAEMPSFINFAKVRASVAGTGSGVTKPYMTNFAYQKPPNLVGGGNIMNPTGLVNPMILPLKTSSYEVGMDVRMFRKRVNLDVALYKANTFSQHLNRIVDASSGVSRYLINLGEVQNSGVEVALNTDQIKKDSGFNWSSMLTYTSNKNEIKQLADSSIVLQQRSVGSGQIVGFVGGSLGDLYGLGYERAPDGQIIYDESTGYAKITKEVIYLGNTIPKGKMSLGNNFSYKGIRLNVLFDAQWGGVAHSLTHYKLAEQGKTVNTLPGRYSGLIGNGVIQNADGSFRPNDVIATNVDEYYRSHYGADNAEGSTFATDFLKFREARLDYTFNRNVVKRLGINRATIGVYGRDLFIWTKWPAFDPEFGTLDGSDIVKGFEIAQFPSTRTFGFNLVVGF